MHMIAVDDLTISLMVLIGVRFLAFFVFLELFLRQREDKYAVLALAWLVYMAGPVSGLLGYSTSGNPDPPLFGYFVAVGTFLLMGGVFLYYRAMSRAKLILGVSLVVTALGIAVLVYPEASGVLAILAQVMFVATMLVVLLFRRKWFLAFGGNSYYWLLPITLLSLFHAFGFRFVYPGAPLSVRFYATFLVNVSLLIFFLHFEYNQSLMRLSESEERYRFLFNAAPVALWEEDATEITASLAGLRSLGISDIRRYFNAHPELVEETLRQLRVLNVNREAMLLFGASSIQELSSEFDKTFGPKSYQAFAEAVARLFEGSRQTTIEATVQTIEGEARDVIVDIHFPNPDETPSTTIVSMVDVTERKRAEEALKEYSERLEEMVEERTQELQDAQEQLVRREKLAALGQLAGGVAHELRTPLGVISNAGYYLKLVYPDADETTKEYLDMISAEVGKATKIISDLLDSTHVKSSERQPATISALVDHTFAQCPAAENVQVNLQIPPDLPTLFVDPQQIEQVLANLITNAYQAMPEGGTLTISAKAEQAGATLSIADTGCGTSLENMDKLFEPLFTTKARGIGLGLAISKNLVEANGGTIEVESDSVPGKGSTFTVTLPTGDVL
ncbi:MAG: hypothetical protein H8E35_16030 [Ardenticatenia bacterium]|nr:hypothetical protein [Ardenticatenia bacterium]